jgi:hypothetical protein
MMITMTLNHLGCGQGKTRTPYSSLSSPLSLSLSLLSSLSLSLSSSLPLTLHFLRFLNFPSLSSFHLLPSLSSSSSRPLLQLTFYLFQRGDTALIAVGIVTWIIEALGFVLFVFANILRSTFDVMHILVFGFAVCAIAVTSEIFRGDLDQLCMVGGGINAPC